MRTALDISGVNEWVCSSSDDSDDDGAEYDSSNAKVDNEMVNASTKRTLS